MQLTHDPGTDCAPRCPECGAPLNRDARSCTHVEAKLPQMEVHRTETLARRLVYLEAQVAILIERETDRVARKINTPNTRGRTRR